MGPVERDALVFLAAAIALAFTVVILAARGFTSRRALRQRIEATVARLEPDGGRTRGLEATLARLERAVDDALYSRSDASSDATRLRLALDGLPLGLVVCDEHGKVIERTPGATEVLRTVDDQPLDPALRAALDAVLQASLAGRPSARDAEMPGPPMRALRLTGVPLDDGRRSVGAMVVIEDLTDLRRRGSARDDLVVALARVMIEPLAGLAVIADGLVDEVDPAARERLAERARAEAARARAMVDDIIELTRLVAEERRQRERVALVAVVENAVERNRALADQRRVQLRVVPSPRVDVELDRRQVDLACQKLLQHALEGARPGATLEVRVRTGADGADVEVREPGSSIAGPWRAGLALAVVEQAAKNLGGSVREGAAPGIGRTCTLRLPSAGAVPASVPPPVPRAV